MKNPSDLQKFNDLVLSQFAKTITNQVFLLVQNNKKLMKVYLKLVHKYGEHTVNKTLGRKIKTTYHLTNSDKEKNPSSTLIQSHTRF